MMERVYLSFGAGVQSTALAMLAINRDPRLLEVTEGRVPSVALFADTGDERAETYGHVWRMADVFQSAGMRYEIVRRKGEISLSGHVIGRATDGKGSISTPPLFLDTPSRSTERGKALRGCTRDFKARPLDRRAKAIFEATHKRPVEQWIGISRDEVERMRDSDQKWRSVRYPLVWMGWTRAKCAGYVAKQRYLDGSTMIPGRSACVFCPFHHASEWRRVKNSAEDWARALEFDEQLRQAHAAHGHIAGLSGVPYLTTELKPLRECSFDANSGQLSLWGEECSGLCGV